MDNKKEKAEKVYCDECKYEFYITLRKEKLKDRIERIYFICPKCKKEYTAYYTNDVIKANQVKIRRLKEENEEEIKKIFEKVNK